MDRCQVRDMKARQCTLPAQHLCKCDFVSARPMSLLHAIAWKEEIRLQRAAAVVEKKDRRE